MSFWYLVAHSGLAKADAPKGVGIFLLAWTIFSIYMTVVTARISGLLFTLVLRPGRHLPVPDGRRLRQCPVLTHIGGYLGLITALMAWYASAFAGVLNGTDKRIVMPTWPR